jgi:hypothetical protein
MVFVIPVVKHALLKSATDVQLAPELIIIMEISSFYILQNRLVRNRLRSNNVCLNTGGPWVAMRTNRAHDIARVREFWYCTK